MTNAGRPDVQRLEPYDLSLDRNPGAAKRAAVRAPRTSKPQAQAARPRSRLRPAILSGLGGFVLGAVFWHLVGFWTFVSHVVLKGPAADAQHATIETGSLRPREVRQREVARPEVTTRSAAGRLRHLATGTAQNAVAPAPAQPCADAASDASGSTTAPCAGEAIAAQPAAEPPPAKPDLIAVRATPAEVAAPAAAGWTVEVEASAAHRPNR